MNQDGVIGMELLIDPGITTVQLCSLVSSKPGYGRKIVDAVVRGTHDDWNIFVVMDWSRGFWDRMFEKNQHIVVF